MQLLYSPSFFIDQMSRFSMFYHDMSQKCQQQIQIPQVLQFGRDGGLFLLNILLKAVSKLIQTRTLFCPVLKIFAALEITIRNGNTVNYKLCNLPYATSTKKRVKICVIIQTRIRRILSYLHPIFQLSRNNCDFQIKYIEIFISIQYCSSQSAKKCWEFLFGHI